MNLLVFLVRLRTFTIADVAVRKEYQTNGIGKNHFDLTENNLQPDSAATAFRRQQLVTYRCEDFLENEKKI